MTGSPERRREQQAARRRRLAAALEDALPEQTRDDAADAWDESTAVRGGAGHDEWLRSQVPPHHG